MSFRALAREEEDSNKQKNIWKMRYQTSHKSGTACKHAIKVSAPLLFEQDKQIVTSVLFPPASDKVINPTVHWQGHALLMQRAQIRIHVEI